MQRLVAVPGVAGGLVGLVAPMVFVLCCNDVKLQWEPWISTVQSVLQHALLFWHLSSAQRAQTAKALGVKKVLRGTHLVSSIRTGRRDQTRLLRMKYRILSCGCAGIPRTTMPIVPVMPMQL
ncbi:hypothetical protein F5884DRAFT_353369 [Xylogone sp. PMI_703]|nr:hypothetical protein F5884DRAFT_353369 [Xylogone sp. PMI_703]